MPAVINTDAPGHKGCRIVGRWLAPDGQPISEPIYITPERGGQFGGVVYHRVAVVVTPDSQGQWVVVLPPSSVLGTYQVAFGPARYTMTVPADPTATFHSIARPA